MLLAQIYQPQCHRNGTKTTICLRNGTVKKRTQLLALSGLWKCNNLNYVGCCFPSNTWSIFLNLAARRKDLDNSWHARHPSFTKSRLRCSEEELAFELASLWNSLLISHLEDGKISFSHEDIGGWWYFPNWVCVLPLWWCDRLRPVAIRNLFLSMMLD